MPRAWVCIFAVITLLALGAGPLAAQPVGEVESIGFNNVYRPGCWTPMVVRIRPNAAPTGTYQLQVKQRDLDNDIAVFTRPISLTGAAQGGAREQRFWMYFIPQPVNKGLPDTRAGATLKDFQEAIEVYLCDETGRQLTQLPVTAPVESLDPPVGIMDSDRGARLLLAVNEGNSRPAWDEYRAGLDQRDKLLGVTENLVLMPVRPRDLPEHPLAYESVDAVVWFDADPAALQSDGGLRRRAMEDWVRRGGHLVICQSPNWQPALAFGDLLPVELEGGATRPEPEPLRSIALSGRRGVARAQAWDALPGPFRLTRATPRPDALVDVWMELPPSDEFAGGRRPYIARRVYGCGAVTWVAQDLGDPALTLAARTGWVNVWDRVLDLRNDPVAGDAIDPDDERVYPVGGGVDLGAWLNVGLESSARVGLFIALAVVFFVVYWLVAGPGLFFFLLSRRRTHLSWFAFAATALAATLLTVGVVRLVLRGPPSVNHRSVVRAGTGAGMTIARFGLYIPRDGNQTLALAPAPSADGAPAGIATLAALPRHPAHLRGELGTAGKLSYTVPIADVTDTAAAELTVPYRSTLKQFQAWQAGQGPRGRIEGFATVDPTVRGDIGGTLTNGTGVDLRDAYVAYKVQRGGRGEDWMIYLPRWPAGVSLDLSRERQALGVSALVGGTDSGSVPGNNRALFGQIGTDWLDYWQRDLRGLLQMGEAQWDDPPGRAPRALPMLSFFDRLPPVRAPLTGAGTRFELLRRGARWMDLSPALAAGAVVVVAHGVEPGGTPSPLPLGLKVEGDDVPGVGTTVYQFVVPTVRPPPSQAVDPPVDAEPPTVERTLPATQPEPGGGP